ncbi:NADP-dependent oxidoreductase [Gandjariella thermophila]|uniref:NADP-dependent oxidoreductase n=1 Tax=Gandjariella thermophila TaxID=1931992 RepID=A0A4D4J6J8_9PSEU|nr:NADP-dependent oxidoreductase [Gandjariella thermophila]GDY30136.1 NADP-dependent oxidoreductase [Gandjariella thermophila]
MTVPSTALEVRLASRPQGWPTEDNFEIAEVAVPKPEAGQVLVRNTLMSVDPYMRGRMNDVKSYVPPFAIGKPLEGGAVGEVVESTVDDLKPGDFVLHGLGWREYALPDAKHATKVDPNVAPLGAYLGVLGMPGLTAYAGLLEVAAFREGDAVFVSGAAGAVGQVAGQIARLRGASRVIGSAGSAAKVRYLTDELGFDAAFNYKDGPVVEQLRAAAPDGIDVYFDNVGGDHLEAALTVLNTHGRAALCGAIAQYNDTAPPPGPRNLALAITKRLTLRGFIVMDHQHLQQDFVREVGSWVRDGKLRYTETVVDGGVRRAPEAFLGMLRGQNTGKMLVKLAD